ncbi:hypothetical protein N7G274_009725 [Stereocaulon virgatum]|uniref:AB hydrolase-1 domain-containing protein n=1 Tax=Stereocaulon virgatum TaxID=373712 RepID=A0ABR3ZV10_9LECA
MTKRIAQEGLIPFNVPAANKPCHTWYRIVGDLSSSSTPLVTLHGGPGACHEYLLPLRDLNVENCIPIIFYDQIGNGRSTRLREKSGDEEFWTEELFRAELDNMVDHLDLRSRGFDILGQSWGGMLASKYAALHPKGLRKLVLANTCASVKLLLEGTNVLRAQLPKDVQEVLDKCEKEENVESEEYEQACVVFYKRHLCRLDPWPKEVEAALGHLKDDPTVYKTMYGPSELVSTGNLKNWSAIDEAHNIMVPTLLINGKYDEVQDVAVAPFFEQISKVKWVTLEQSSHMGHFEERKRFMEIVGRFLSG